MIEESSPPPSFVYSGTNDLEVDVGIFGEFLATGGSTTQDARGRAKRLAELGLEAQDENSELLKKLDELDNTIVEIDAEPIDISLFGSALWSLSEEQLTGILPFIDGDMSMLDFPHESE